MPIYNLSGYSENYSLTSESSWNYCEDKVDNVNDNGSGGNSLKYNTKITGKREERSTQSRNEGEMLSDHHEV